MFESVVVQTVNWGCWGTGWSNICFLTPLRRQSISTKRTVRFILIWGFSFGFSGVALGEWLPLSPLGWYFQPSYRLNLLVLVVHLNCCSIFVPKFTSIIKTLLYFSESILFPKVVVSLINCLNIRAKNKITFIIHKILQPNIPIQPKK